MPLSNNLVAAFGGESGISDFAAIHLQTENSENAWKIFSVWLSEKSSRAASYYFYNKMLCAGLANTKATAEAIVSVLEKLQPIEDLNHFAQMLKPQLLSSTKMMPLGVLKFNDGTFEDKINLISEYLHLTQSAYNLSLPSYYQANSQTEVASFRATLKKLIDESREQQSAFEPFFSIKKYANGNIDVKPKSTDYLNLFFDQDYFTHE